jgi:hypothetical protein
MTFEERLEFLLRLSESNESNILRLHDDIRALRDETLALQNLHAGAERRLTRLEEHQAKNEVLMTQVLESINALGGVALDHRNRIEDLEGGRGTQ